MLATVGDLIEDVVVTPERVVPGLLGDERSESRSLVLHMAADTPARVVRRRGGSAATVAVAAVAAVSARQRGVGRHSAGAGAVRYIGQVGDDAVGRRLVDELRAAGVEPVVRHAGRTGTIIVLLHPDGERSMLTDRGSAAELDDPQPSWLDGVRLLHVPLYSLLAEPLAATCRTLIGWASERGIDVSIDASSTSAIEGVGAGVATDLIADLAPTFLLANQAEAALLATAPPSHPPMGLGGLATVAVIEKRGPGPAVVHPGAGAPETPVAVVAAHDLGPVADTTGAGDAFAAGFLMSWLAGADVVESAGSGHDVAADHLRALASGQSR